jgi:hypothetical protein
MEANGRSETYEFCFNTGCKRKYPFPLLQLGIATGRQNVNVPVLGADAVHK